MARNALGRGLGALIREPDPQPANVTNPADRFASRTKLQV